MGQNIDILAKARRYTRADFAALQMHLNKLPVETIQQLFGVDELEERGFDDPATLLGWLSEMRDYLADRAASKNPLISSMLADARKTQTWSRKLADFLFAAADEDMSSPRPDDAISAWFKRQTHRAFSEVGLRTLAELKEWMLARGRAWHRPIPRIGAQRARVVERWFEANTRYLGEFVLEEEPAKTAAGTLLSPAGGLRPLERISGIEPHLDGARGVNRNDRFCLIGARNDLEAIEAYLYKFRDQAKTLRAYQRELERFLLWCVTVRRIPLSSVLVAECEAYKDFLANIDPAWVGPRTARMSRRWRPFANAELKPESQRYAIQVLRAFFEWLVRVRYLGGNPWATVADPRVATKEYLIDVDKALPENVWLQLAGKGGILEQLSEFLPLLIQVRRPEGERYRVVSPAQCRLARAAILLMGTGGLRREEVARARREHLKPAREQAGRAQGVWELAVLGKRNRWRTVFLPVATVVAIQEHWADRGDDFAHGASARHLLSPVVAESPRARRKHQDEAGQLTGAGFSPDGLYTVVKSTLIRIAQHPDLELTPATRHLLEAAAPHAMRHTFATRAAAKVELDVLRQSLGHASLNTTSIYVKAERARMLEQMSKFLEEAE